MITTGKEIGRQMKIYSRKLIHYISFYVIFLVDSSAPLWKKDNLQAPTQTDCYNTLNADLGINRITELRQKTIPLTSQHQIRSTTSAKQACLYYMISMSDEGCKRIKENGWNWQYYKLQEKIIGVAHDAFRMRKITCNKCLNMKKQRKTLT